MKSVNDVIERVRAEYLDMPGLRLTAAQIQRLCGIERILCAAVLEALVEAGFLFVGPNGRYQRLPEEGLRRPQPAKADLRPASQRIVSS